MEKYKPDNYNSLSAYLIVDHAQKLVNLLTKVFNAKTLRQDLDQHMEWSFRAGDIKI